MRVTYLSVGWVKLGRERPLRSSSPNNDPTPSCQPQTSITVPQISLSSIRLSREGISVMVVSLPHPSSSTYQRWIFTCCFIVNPLLSLNPSATLCFHCHHYREPRGPNSAARFGGLLLPSAHDRTKDTAKQKAEQQLREQSHLDTPPVPSPRRRAAGFASSFFHNSD